MNKGVYDNACMKWLYIDELLEEVKKSKFLTFCNFFAFIHTPDFFKGKPLKKDVFYTASFKLSPNIFEEINEQESIFSLKDVIHKKDYKVELFHNYYISNNNTPVTDVYCYVVAVFTFDDFDANLILSIKCSICYEASLGKLDSKHIHTYITIINLLKQVIDGNVPLSLFAPDDGIYKFVGNTSLVWEIIENPEENKDFIIEVFLWNQDCLIDRNITFNVCHNIINVHTYKRYKIQDLDHYLKRSVFLSKEGFDENFSSFLMNSTQNYFVFSPEEEEVLYEVKTKGRLFSKGSFMY